MSARSDIVMKTIEDTLKYIDDLEAENARLKSLQATEWIRCEDRMPPPYTDVLTKSYDCVKEVLRHEAHWWYGKDKDFMPEFWLESKAMDSLLKQVRALPTPPQVSKEV